VPGTDVEPVPSESEPESEREREPEPEPDASVADDSTPDGSSTSAPPSVGDVAGSEPAGTPAYELVAALTSDRLGGRDNRTAGNEAARDLLIEELSTFADPAFPGRGGVDGYVQEFDLGTNIIAVVPGTDLADEYVLIGAHYDSVGPDKCREIGSRGDTICNGATDNAAGVAAVVEIARAIAAGGPPRRSLVVALWDAEEDTLAGSRHYISSPVVPLADTVAYVNFDIQGAQLTPATADWTVVQAADTGGPPLVEATESAIAGSNLHYLSLGVAVSPTRSDHDSLLRGGVPSVSFGDGTNGCYHTVDDELEVVDFDKLAEQIAVAERLVADLVDTDSPPVTPSERPTPSFEDLSQLHDLFEAIEADVALLPDGAEEYLAEVRAALAAVVAGGADAFDPTGLADTLRRGFLLEAYLSDLPCTPV
jgi:hypothetical protein